MSVYTVRVLDPERAATLRRVFGADEFAVVGPVLYPFLLPGRPVPEWCYMLALDALTLDQRVRLVAVIALRFDLDPFDVERDLGRVGVPVLADSCELRVDGVVSAPSYYTP